GMRKIKVGGLAGGFFIFAGIVMAFTGIEKIFPADRLPEDDGYEEVIGCAPPGAVLTPISYADRKIVPLPGWGNHSWKITSASDSAQFYFDQGLNLFYSFHIQESRASFEEAIRHDPDCAMAYWG